MSQFISIQGAREHNLKNISLKIPRNQFTVITGLSGSGKSSLAFDTIYAEGQRRYVESLSPYARQFLEKMKKPEIDKISGLSPSISIEQKHITKNPRSTVGTITEIYDYLRLLFAKIGAIASNDPNAPLSNLSTKDIFLTLKEEGDGKYLTILGQVVRERKGEFRDVLEKIRKKGFSKVKIDGEFQEIKEGMKLLKSKRHDIHVVMNRIELEDANQDEIEKSIEEAMDIGEGICLVEISSEVPNLKKARKKKVKTLSFSKNLIFPDGTTGSDKLSPNMFSFNSSMGACQKCKGLGIVTKLLKGFILADENKPILQGALNKEIYFSFNKYFINDLVHDLKETFQFDLRTPFKDLPEEVKEAFFWGNQEYYGIFDELKEQLHKTSSVNVRNKVRKFLREEICPSCKGGRLSEKSLSVKVNKKNIVELSEYSLDQLKEFFDGLKISKEKKELASEIISEIQIRLKSLTEMGLGYLTINRPAATLAGGEVQRVRLASQIGTGLTGVLYVLDEPSIGLHPRDNDKLLHLLEDLKKLNNTIVVVEHDEATMKSADQLIDLGPGAGEAGGKINFSVPRKQLEKTPSKNSLTLQYLRGEKEIPTPKKRKEVNLKQVLSLKGVEQNNLKKVNLEIPLGLFVCVTGVSGSGKSTLIHDVLYKAIHNELWKTDYQVGKMKSLKGIDQLDKIVEIDQSPIGRTSRSNPATYIEVFTSIRNLFSQLPESKIKGFSQGRFSFNVKGGRCETCEGAGLERLEMSFLPDVHVECDVCGGKRYNQETLSIRYKGKSIADVLEMPVHEALEFFNSIPQIRDRLQVLEDVGLGYIRLGQPSTTLSGGEAQRIKIAYELCKKATGKTLYILDEPTTGLHFADIHHLLLALLKLRDTGNSVIIIEHNLDVVKMADYLIDLGPEGGDGGGQIVALGTPEDVSKNKKSHTGRYLKSYLK